MSQSGFSKILTYKSDTASTIPSAANLTNSSTGAELAVNTADKRLFTKDSGGNVVEVGTNPSSLTLPNGVANGVLYANGSKAVTSGSALTFDGTRLLVGRATSDANNWGIQNYSAAGAYQSGFQMVYGGVGAAALWIPAASSLAFGADAGAGTTELMRLTSTGLGIGTSSTAEKLTVAGRISFDAYSTDADIFGMYAVNGVGTTISTYSGYSNHIAFRIGSEQMRLTTTGLGIGTSSPNYGGWTKAVSLVLPAGSAALEAGTATTTANAVVGAMDFIQTSNSSAKEVAQIAAHNTGSTSGNTGAYLTFWTKPDAGAITKQMTLDSAGNLVLGTTSALGGGKFSIQTDLTTTNGIVLKDTASTYAANDNFLLFQNSAGSTAGGITHPASQTLGIWGYNGINFYYGASTFGATLDGSGNLGLGVTPSAWNTSYKAFQNSAGALVGVGTGEQALLNNAYIATSGNYTYTNTAASSRYSLSAGAHYWFIAPSGTAGNAISFTQAMTLDASGNLALGLTSAARRLEVSGASSGETYQMRLGAGVSNTAYTYDIGRSTVDGYFRFYGNQTGAIGYIFSGVDGERARIDSSGNLLVGTTSNTATGGILHAQGATNSAAIGAYAKGTTSSAVGYYCKVDSVNALYAYWNCNGVNTGSISTSGTTTAYNTSSDYRLKNTIAPMQNALAKVAQLKPVTYKWNADNSDGQGFIAHELQAVIPEAVTGEKDAVDADGNPVYQGIDPSKIVATLTAAIQEQQAIIESLQADIAILKGK